MPGLSSPLTGGDGQLMASASDLGQWAGFAITVTQASWTTPTTGHLAKEVANPLLVDGQPIRFIGEPPLVFRHYDATAHHARKVCLPWGETVDLTTDAAAVLATTGVPASNVGANNDIAVNLTTRQIYLKASGAWSNMKIVSVTAGRTFLTSDINKEVRCTNGSAQVFTLAGSTFGDPADTIALKQTGAGTLSVVQGTGATLKIPARLVTEADGDRVVLQCEAPGVWTGL